MKRRLQELDRFAFTKKTREAAVSTERTVSEIAPPSSPVTAGLNPEVYARANPGATPGATPEVTVGTTPEVTVGTNPGATVGTTPEATVGTTPGATGVGMAYPLSTCLDYAGEKTLLTSLRKTRGLLDATVGVQDGKLHYSAARTTKVLDLSPVVELRLKTVLRFLPWCSRPDLLRDKKLCRRVVSTCQDLFSAYPCSDDVVNPCEFMYTRRPDIQPTDIVEASPVGTRLDWPDARRLWNPAHSTPALLVQTAVTSRLARVWTRRGGSPVLPLATAQREVREELGRLGLGVSREDADRLWADHAHQGCRGYHIPVFVGDAYACFQVFQDVAGELAAMCRHRVAAGFPLAPGAGAALEGLRADRPLHPTQLASVLHCLAHGLTVVTGTGGTGKTEIATVAAQYLGEGGAGRCSFVTPTGKASKIARDRVGGVIDVNTLHMWALSGGTGPRRCELLVVDECSMVNLCTMYVVFRLARSLRIPRILLLGDDLQLPPVCNDGNLFRDLLASRPLSDCVFRLEHNYRAEKGLLRLLGSTRTPDFLQPDHFASPECRLFVEDSVLASLNRLRLVIGGLTPAQRACTQVVCTTRAPLIAPQVALTAVPTLLAVLNLFNPCPDRKPGVFYPADRVMNCVNLYQVRAREGNLEKKLLLANGDTGVLRDRRVAVFDGGVVIDLLQKQCLSHRGVKSEDVAVAVHSWQFAKLTTVHRLQGSESDGVVFFSTAGYGTFNTRELLYTGLSRARRQIAVIMDTPRWKNFRYPRFTKRHGVGPTALL